MQLRGIKVTVSSAVSQVGQAGTYNGQAPCPEYAAKQIDPEEQGRIVERYIPAREGREFSIVVVNESANDVSCVFYVDGQMANCLLCYALPKVNSVTCYGVEPQPGRLRKFVFRKAVLTGILPRKHH